MITIIGVRFRTNGKVYYFDPGNFDVRLKDHVIVETARGVEYGEVVLGPKQVTDDRIVNPLKPIIRIASLKDEATLHENREREKKAFDICLEKIAAHGLDMKLIDSEYTFDRSKLLFYFTSDGRVDFRELVKDLAAIFKIRIELRQIGVRDETRMIGGYGICGRPLCCSTFLSDFSPVSIKMAKDQGLSLNPSKISGVCGRLMCCLQNEEDAYLHLNSSLPSIGTTVKTIDGYTGEVQKLSVLKQMVSVLIETDNEEKELREYKASELEYTTKSNTRHTITQVLPDEEVVDEATLRALELMENEDLAELSESMGEQPRYEKKQKKRRPEKRDKDKDKRFEKEFRHEPKDSNSSRGKKPEKKDKHNSSHDKKKNPHVGKKPYIHSEKYTNRESHGRKGNK